MIADTILRVMKPKSVDWRMEFIGEVKVELDRLCAELGWGWVTQNADHLTVRLPNGHEFTLKCEGERQVKISNTASKQEVGIMSAQQGKAMIAHHLMETAKRPAKT